MGAFSPSRLVAVLGPTNTGKTHLAIERMLGHASGMIGFPLRLLARENYDRILRRKGAGAVALITGEEKIIPPHPAYFVCTVESMPLDRGVDFLAVDEIQLCGDPERGHVFTDRLLHARGRAETMFLGSDTIRFLLRRLVPEAEFIARPRLSQLSYLGPRKLTRLAPRSAVVAFAVADVFALAELMRRRRGGTAVVLGALSPRARNAQIGMFESGEVDYLVATDAIGMGLNMDLDHVAFARLAKFDGRSPRRLSAAEIAQIAGRAGRHMNDGTFGTTAELGAMAADYVEAVENHRFDPLDHLYWRNSRLDFRSLHGLIRSLEARPQRAGLMPAPAADDVVALKSLARMDDIEKAATNPGAIRLLWEVCQIPDFRKVMSDTHARLLAQIYRHLMAPPGQIPGEWVARQVTALERLDGDIDTLMARIAHIRTWTYIAHRPDWIRDAATWQERARAIEDRLSDALHDRITQRFVDRRGAFLVKQLAGDQELLASVSHHGTVAVEGHVVGRLEGFRFIPDGDPQDAATRSLVVCANRVLRGETVARVKVLEEAENAEFALGDDGFIRWRQGMVGRLLSGESALQPRLEALPGDFLEGELRESVRRRLIRYLRDHIRASLAPLFHVLEAELTGAARGLAFQLVEGLGSLPKAAVSAQVSALDRSDRRTLGKLGVRLGCQSVYLDSVLDPVSVRLRGILWGVKAGAALPPAPTRIVEPALTGVAGEAYAAMGYLRLGPRIMRVDRAERLAAMARGLARHGPFAATPALAHLAMSPIEDLALMLPALGFRAVLEAGEVTFHGGAKRAPQRPPRRRMAPLATLREVSPLR
ncbi:MAG TPA: helicase-related protein [Stellaceae bacterium]|nr:helicase-related protein [Stellaceae bacterium]